MAARAKSEAGLTERVRETVCVLGEKRHIKNPLSLVEFTKEQYGELPL